MEISAKKIKEMNLVELRGKLQLEECQVQVIRRRSCIEIGGHESLGVFMNMNGERSDLVAELDFTYCPPPIPL